MRRPSPFQKFFSNRTEEGVGLCCEEGARIILSFTEKAEEVILFDDGEEEALTPFEEKLLAFRNELFRLIQNREDSLESGAKRLSLLQRLKFPKKVLPDWAEVFLTLERLDPQWGDILEKLKGTEDSLSFPDDPFQIPFEQLLVCFIYRHVSGAENEDEIPERTAFAVLSVRIIKALCALKFKENGECALEDTAEFARLYSSEIEYSEENTQAIFKLLRGEQYEL